MALSKAKILSLLQDTLIKFYTDVFKPDLDGHTHSYAGSSSVGGSATSANKVNNKLTLQLNGTTSKTFDGSSAQTFNVTPSGIGAAASSHGTHVTYSTTTPKANGTATIGTESTVARGDHVHPLQTTISGNAGSANKVNNTLTIQGNGTSLATFDGSSAKTINITPNNIGAVTQTDINNAIENLDLQLTANNISLKKEDGTIIGSGSEIHTIKHISPTTWTEFFNFTKETTTSNTYYCLTNQVAKVVYNNKQYAIKGLYGVRFYNNVYNYYGYDTLQQFTADLDGNITYATTYSEFIKSKIPTTYAGSSSAGGAATSANKVNSSLTIQGNGTTLNSFDGSSAKTINITPANIGAATQADINTAIGNINTILDEINGEQL